MFDAQTSAELPEHEEFIHNTAIPLLQSRYGIETTILQARTNYYEQFYRTFRKGKRRGQIYGFPFLRGAWCNSRLKMCPINQWAQRTGKHISVVGIAADEPERAAKKTTRGKYLPLVERGITEADAFHICQREGLLSPAYNRGRNRLGCWFCHKQRIGELRRLRADHPELWGKLLALDAESPCKFTPESTVVEFERRFEVEAAQISLFN